MFGEHKIDGKLTDPISIISFINIYLLYLIKTLYSSTQENSIDILSKI